jgi:hypothetical protein
MQIQFQGLTKHFEDLRGRGNPVTFTYVVVPNPPYAPGTTQQIGFDLFDSASNRLLVNRTFQVQ